MVWNDLTDAAEKGLDAVESVAEGVGRDIGGTAELVGASGVDIAAGFVDAVAEHDTANAMRETARGMDAEGYMQIDTAKGLYDQAGMDVYAPPPAEKFDVPSASDFTPPTPWGEYPTNPETTIEPTPDVPPEDLGY